MKSLFKLLTVVFVASLMVIACKDNFSEQDFINNQLKNKAALDTANLKALNRAGQLLSYTIQVLEDKTPVSAVVVVMSNAPAGSAASTVQATSDANGFATFSNVVIGSNTFTISKAGYFPATFIVDFGNVQQGTNYTIVNGSVIPIKRTATSQVPIFSSAATGNTATIRGTVTIETDLTNAVPEIPQGITLKANLIGIFGGVGGSSSSTGEGGQASIQSYFFNTGSIGTAVVNNTTGAYSMTVPASADGREVELIYPLISVNQRVGFNRTNGLNVAPQISSTIPAVFGPSNLAGGFYSSAANNAIPTTPGAIATFSPAAPPAPGSGLKFTFTPVGRSISTGTSGGSEGNPFTIGTGNTTYQLTNRGSGYRTSPTFTLTGGGAAPQAVLSASLIGTATGATIVSGGSGYNGSVTFTLQQSVDGTNFFNTVDVNFNNVSFNQTITGPAAIGSVTLPTSGPGFSTQLVTANSGAGFGVTSFRWNVSGGGGTGANITAIVSTSVDRIQVASGGTGYTSAPSISISAPTSGTTATMSVLEFQTQWNVTLDNATNSSPYRVTPAGITFNYSALGGNFTSANVTDNLGNTAGILTFVTVSNGNVVFIDPNRTFRTSSSSQAPPNPVVTPSTTTPASALVSINSTLNDPGFGRVTGLNTIVAGAGYNTPITVTIAPVTGATGTGATIDISQGISFNSTSGAYTWSGAGIAVTNGGNGYQPFLNAYYQFYGITAGQNVNFSGPSSIVVTTGDVVVQDINYGTGIRKVNIQ